MDLVLLVDRDADTRIMYAEFLKQAAFATDEAEDGREGLAKAISYRPAVVVTETKLPGMSGFELCRLLRLDATTKSTAIVVVTGDATPAAVHLAEAAGADSVLVKPCLPEELAAEIRRLLSRGEPRPQAPDAGRAHHRRVTSEPPLRPPSMLCPVCDKAATYVQSQIGGVSERHAEQWDYFVCAECGGTFEYRQRTRSVRPAASITARRRHG